MKRRLLIIAVFLLAGAVVNVAVAWWCAARSRTHEQPSVEHFESPLQDWFSANAPGDGLRLEGRVGHRRGIGLDLHVMVGADRDRRNRAKLRTECFRTNAGFPFLALGGVYWEVRGEIPKPWGHSYITSGAHLPEQFSTLANRHLGGVLPFRPIWPGFAINTLVYAVLLAALWLFIRVGHFYAFRRVIRIRRGLCPACGYPMGESDVCSECGIPLVPGWPRI